MSKVSVVVPIYNAEKNIEKCIRSVLNQTFLDFELILVNDGSTDNSLKICKKYQEQDKRIIVINKDNEGSCATRRKGLDVASAEYIMFVDADDWIHRRTIETLYDSTINDKVDITVCNMFRVLGNSKLIKQKNKSVYFNENRTYNKEEIKSKLVVAYFHGHPFPPSLCAKLYKKELLQNSGKYLERISFLGDDLYYNLEILLRANHVKILVKPLYYYRSGGFTSKYMPYFFDDIINGYNIQKEVIDEYFLDTKETEYNGISIMLLNTFKTCLYNLFNSGLSQNEIKRHIEIYALNNSLIESTNNVGANSYFQIEYLNAIKNKDIEYLYKIGFKMYKKKKPKKLLMNMLSKIS
ncbi:glycosyltransferase involved in cell wall biosynthesis [Metabacillus crassostreae]|uniref:glycosyltransferase family 2 protein n=1 Tax=Metabacillus crassostreae TaxID=929098 RepID=UPI00195C95C8|nr:glycosyltransferase family 2 protein [Metabacillus crassostreae]MBM7604641.1 glycosyltransferase involved in cell wall biosynthesis [Metabacillus crassostreae]